MPDEREGLAAFVDEVCQAAPLRVETDLGSGFVRLRTTEAEKRQAAQDIRCSEDIVIELLRNSRDAHARHIFLAVQKDENRRLLVTVDDGDGIPEAMFERVFESRVTSKLDTAHMDKWGMHGRGMALYSIAVNADDAAVRASELGRGTAIAVRTDLGKIAERTDQSTFPRFECRDDGVFSMRGPRNILRVASEFALECKRSCDIFVGSFAEVAATLYAFGMATTTPASRAFGRRHSQAEEQATLPQKLAFAIDADDLADRARRLGLEISSRTARRIINGEIEPLMPLYDRLESEALPSAPEAREPGKGEEERDGKGRSARGIRLSGEERAALSRDIAAAFAPIAAAYYLEPDVEPDIAVRDGRLVISLPLVQQ